MRIDNPHYLKFTGGRISQVECPHCGEVLVEKNGEKTSVKPGYADVYIEYEEHGEIKVHTQPMCKKCAAEIPDEHLPDVMAASEWGEIETARQRGVPYKPMFGKKVVVRRKAGFCAAGYALMGGQGVVHGLRG